MTSRELLDKILQSPITKAVGGCFMKNDELETIKKDLERLEKLERIFEILQRHLYVCSGFIECRITTEKNFRECLSNSWTKFYNGMKVIDEDYYELYDLWNELLKEGKQNDN